MAATVSLVDALMDAHTASGSLANSKNLQGEKWDWALPENLVRRAYACSTSISKKHWSGRRAALLLALTTRAGNIK